MKLYGVSFDDSNRQTLYMVTAFAHVTDKFPDSCANLILFLNAATDENVKPSVP